LTTAVASPEAENAAQKARNAAHRSFFERTGPSARAHRFEYELTERLRSLISESLTTAPDHGICEPAQPLRSLKSRNLVGPVELG